MVINVDSIDWNVYNVFFLLEWSKSDQDFGLLIRLQNSLAWLALNFTSVLLWNLPFIFDWDSRFILDNDLLLRANSNISGWIEQFVVIGEGKGWLVAVSDQVNVLDVAR